MTKKLITKKPDIFAPFETYIQGNIVIEDLEDIPAEGLTPEETTKRLKIMKEGAKKQCTTQARDNVIAILSDLICVLIMFKIL